MQKQPTGWISEHTYIGETGKNGHCKVVNNQIKFSAKSFTVREESAFYKHIVQAHHEQYTEGDKLEKHYSKSLGMERSIMG